jgi:acyl-homoserine lactone acylase PvdQ
VRTARTHLPHDFYAPTSAVFVAGDLRHNSHVNRVGRWLLSCVVTAVLGLCAACDRSRQAPAPPLVAQVAGTLPVSSLTAPVRVVRDAWGVPHIYAKTEDDLFVAQGFVQAQDRLFQMDLWRRSAQGRLSEVLGPNFIERDAMTRRIQYTGDVGADWASHGPHTRAIAAAFVRGVNAWVAMARDRPPEQFVLAGWKPELWSADDLLNRTDAFTASGDALDEVFRARLIAAVGLPRARVLLDGDRRMELTTGIDAAIVPDLAAEAMRRVGTPPFFLGLAAPVVDGTVRSAHPRDASARPVAHPSTRYFVHLQAPGWNVIGATAPWRPGVAAGHNDRVAWSAEPFDADTQDLYVEKLNPANARQVEDRGQWVDIETHKDRIAVRGRKAPVEFERDTTRHGVVVAFDRERHLAFALRWSGSEPGAAPELGALALDRAASSSELRAALAGWKMPARRVTYADVEGRRGSAVAALVPRRRGWSGTLPVPGWSGAAEWSGWVQAPYPAPIPTPRALAANAILDAVRFRADRADALLKTLADASAARDSLTAQRGAIVDALAEHLRERGAPVDQPVLFAHPLSVTDAARRRFNIAAKTPSTHGSERFAMAFTPEDWDQSTGVGAPGQSESPDSPNFADLAALWSEGKSFPLAFTDAAVQTHAAATLTLIPR